MELNPLIHVKTDSHWNMKYFSYVMVLSVRGYRVYAWFDDCLCFSSLEMELNVDVNPSPIEPEYVLSLQTV